MIPTSCAKAPIERTGSRLGHEEFAPRSDSSAELLTPSERAGGTHTGAWERSSATSAKLGAREPHGPNPWSEGKGHQVQAPLEYTARGYSRATRGDPTPARSAPVHRRSGVRTNVRSGLPSTHERTKPLSCTTETDAETAEKRQPRPPGPCHHLATRGIRTSRRVHAAVRCHFPVGGWR